MTAPAIEVHGLGKVYDGSGEPLAALEDVGFTVEPGQFVTLVGPSGCGKSTLLQILAGLAEASAGSVLVDGRVLSEPRPEAIGMVFQSALLLPWLTARDNVAFPLDLQGVPRDERVARADALLALVELEDFADRYPDELSVGMRQRVAIARGLSHDPSILLMDEPFAALDEQTRTRMGAELLRIWEQTGKTVFFVTHSLNEAIFLSDRVLVMGPRPGRILDAVKIDLPRPRRFEDMALESFGRTRNRIWDLIGQCGG